MRTYNRAVTFFKIITFKIGYSSLHCTLTMIKKKNCRPHCWVYYHHDQDIANNMDARYVLDSPIFNIEGPCCRLRYFYIWIKTIVHSRDCQDRGREVGISPRLDKCNQGGTSFSCMMVHVMGHIIGLHGKENQTKFKCATLFTTE